MSTTIDCGDGIDSRTGLVLNEVVSRWDGMLVDCSAALRGRTTPWGHHPTPTHPNSYLLPVPVGRSTFESVVGSRLKAISNVARSSYRSRRFFDWEKHNVFPIYICTYVDVHAEMGCTTRFRNVECYRRSGNGNVS